MVGAKPCVRVILWKKFVAMALRCSMYLDRCVDWCLHQRLDQHGHLVRPFLVEEPSATGFSTFLPVALCVPTSAVLFFVGDTIWWDAGLRPRDASEEVPSQSALCCVVFFRSA